MRKRKILTTLLAAVLAAATVSGACALGSGSTVPGRLKTEADSTLPVIPEVTVSGTRVTETDAEGTEIDTGFFEVSLMVSAKEFQSVGAVLSYDATVLKPVTWNTGAEVAVPGGDWYHPTVLPTKGADGLAGKPALSYTAYASDGTTPTGRGILYLGADALQYTALKNERVVTVRFAYQEGKGPDDVTMPTAEVEVKEGAAPNTIEFADAAAVKDSIPGAPLLATAGETGVYTYGETYEDVIYTAAFTLGSGPSAGTGTGASGGGYAITFFDWDGRVIDAITAQQNAVDAVALWQATDAVKTRLNGKPGYSFDTWLLVEQTESGLKPAHGTLTSSKGGVASTNLDQTDFSDLSACTAEGSVSVLVQAAYQTTKAVNGGQGADASLVEDFSRYQFGAPTFYQYGSADANNGQYAVRCTVGRGSVLRADAPTVLAKVYVGSGSNMQMVTVKVDLENTDGTSFEVVVPKSTTRVTWQVLDTYGVTAWTTGTPRSVENAIDHDTIVKEGAFAMLVDEALNAKTSGTWSTNVNTQCFRDAGYSKVNDGNLAAAKAALVSATADTPLNRAEADIALAAYR